MSSEVPNYDFMMFEQFEQISKRPKKDHSSNRFSNVSTAPFMPSFVSNTNLTANNFPKGFSLPMPFSNPTISNALPF